MSITTPTHRTPRPAPLTARDCNARAAEVAGARSTTASEGLDRFRRKIRTHSPVARPRPLNEALRVAPPGLDDPAAYQRREVGRRLLEGELPQPTWYS